MNAMFFFICAEDGTAIDLPLLADVDAGEWAGYKQMWRSEGTKQILDSLYNWLAGELQQRAETPQSPTEDPDEEPAAEPAAAPVAEPVGVGRQ